MFIAVLGHTDKRPVVYSLIKLLQSTGDVAVITNDRHFQRLLENNSTIGHFNNVLITVTDLSPDEIFMEINHAPSDFDHVIFDTQNMLPEDVDLVLYIKGFELEEGDQDLLDCIDNCIIVNMCYSRSEKGAINVSPSYDMFKAVEIFESKKLLVPIPPKQLKTGLANLLAPKLKMNEKEAFKILNRGWK